MSARDPLHRPSPAAVAAPVGSAAADHAVAPAAAAPAPGRVTDAAAQPRGGPPLRILFVTPECAPWVKTGGLGDVSLALPRALARLGHRVQVLLPAYAALRDVARQAEPVARWPAAEPWPASTLLRADEAITRQYGFELLLLDCPPLYGGEGAGSTPYQDASGRDWPDNALRFAWLSLVAARLAAGQVPGWPAADILHANDWPTGWAPAYLAMLQGRAGIAPVALSGGLPPGPPAWHVKSVFTVHNLAFQGLFPLHEGWRLQLHPAWLQPGAPAEFWGQAAMLKAGLELSDAITTVSPTYAQEICREPLGFGLQGVLTAHAGKLHGLLNGIDTDDWDPSTDRHIARRYDAASVTEGKAANRAALREQMGLPARLDPPEPAGSAGAGDRHGARAEPMLFGLISRLTEQKGVDLVLANLDWFIQAGHQLVVLGTGDAQLEAALREAARQHPQHIAVHIGFSEALAHLIEAGADAFLMPSRFEPCGLNQMYSQRYGTLPIVHATGGLADSVHESPAEAQTGFSLPTPSAPALRAALERAASLHADAPGWLQLQQRCMALERGWPQQAGGYLALYRGLAAGSRQAA